MAAKWREMGVIGVKMAKNAICLSVYISNMVIAIGNLKTDLKSSLNYLSGVSHPFFTYSSPFRGNFDFKISNF
jgi:hypothetical protein